MSVDVSSILGGTEPALFGAGRGPQAVAAASRLRSFRRGQVVFTRGDPGDTVIVVVSGRVKVVVRSADGGELTLAVIESGGMFGELSVADGGPRSTDAETLEECQLLLVPREAIQDVCLRVPVSGAGPDRLHRGDPSAADRCRVRPGLPRPSPPGREGAAQPARRRATG